jgi:GAF domain-containing protein
MNRKYRFQFRQSIRTRLLAFSLGMVLITVAVVAYLAINSIQTSGERALQTGEQSLRTQTEDFMLTQIVETAKNDDLLFEKISQDAENLATYAARVFDNPDAFARGSYWLAENHMFVGPEGQYINGESDISTVFVPNFVKVDDALTKELELSAYLDMMFPTVFDDDSNTVAVYLITQKEISRLYPNINLGSIVPGNYSAVQDIFFSIGAPQNNPERNVVWTPVYDDPAGQGLLVSVIAPVYTSGNKFVGVVGIDVSLSGLTASVGAEKLVADGYTFLIDRDSRALALPDQGYVDILGRSREVDEVSPDLGAASPEFSPIIANAVAGETKFQSVSVNGRELFVAYSPLPTTGWARVNVFEAEKMLAAVDVLKTELNASTRSLVSKQILPLAAVIVVIASIIGMILTNRLIDPIQKLAEGAKRIGTGDWDAPLPEGGQDEVGTLSTAIREMALQIRDSVQGLEQRVADRTKALATAAEVGRRLSAVTNPHQLAVEVVEQVQRAFNYYYAQIYLLDAVGENLVLTGGTGEAGAAMLARGHSLPKGRGLVGRAADTNESILVPDVSQEEGWLPNELLPETRTEAAVPISVGNQVLGVLDVQHSLVNGLTSDDVTLLESLASQAAISLQNARTYEQSRRQVELESMVNVIGQKIQRTTTIEDTLQIAIRELGTAIGASRVKASLKPASDGGAAKAVLHPEPLMAETEDREKPIESPAESDGILPAEQTDQEL